MMVKETIEAILDALEPYVRASSSVEEWNISSRIFEIFHTALVRSKIQSK